GHLGALHLLVFRALRRCERAQHRERLEVDSRQADACLAARGDVLVDELAVRDDEQHAARRDSGLRIGALREDLPVEHSLLERDRQCLLRAEPNRVGELLRIVDAADLEGAHADAVVGDAETDRLLRQLVLCEQLFQCAREGLDVAQLTAHDDTVLQRRACVLVQLRHAVARRHACRGDLRRADLQTDELALHRRGRPAEILDLAALRRLRLAELLLPERNALALRLLRGLRLLRRLRRLGLAELALPEGDALALRLLRGLRLLRRLRRLGLAELLLPERDALALRLLGGLRLLCGLRRLGLFRRARERQLLLPERHVLGRSLPRRLDGDRRRLDGGHLDLGRPHGRNVGQRRG